MSQLPLWATRLSEVSGFDPAGDWCRLICTDRGQHAVELLGVVFEDPDGSGRVWGGLHVHLSDRTNAEGVPIDAAGVALPPDPDDPLRVPSASEPGSVTFACPMCPRTPRLDRGAWSRIADAVDIPGVVDVSWYG